MRGAVIHAPGDVRFETLDDPRISCPTDAVIRTVATCVCGSDLWPYRGLEPVGDPHPMGHEYVGIVEEVGAEVTHVRPGQFVVGSFATSDNTCANCLGGWQSSCLHREFMSTCQADYVRIPNAHGTLVATDGQPDADHVPGLLAVSDVMGTGWRAALAAEVRPGSTAVVVGDGAVGLCGGPAPVRRYMSDLIDRVLSGRINPGKVFDLTLPLDQVAEGYRAMDERRAIKALLKP
ncbi:alcohol dehydrogenase catalytic domain-containing protein [Streptomyces sp. NPDC047061]|uniref:alcohol dehydrogenase catalytic domain-containing protein n=1 Tax=Streptomyces sp. NPDC047061 TaxID=3154605 RepID=UPI0033C25EC2